MELEAEVKTGAHSDAGRGGDFRQQRVDAKAFKGKGGLRLVRKLSEDVDSLHKQMRELVDVSLEVPNLVMYLCLHTRHATGQRSLRWRSTGGAAKHLPWAQAHEVIDQMPTAVAEWYRDVTARAHLLNQTEKALRPQLRQARVAAGLTEDGLPSNQTTLLD